MCLYYAFGEILPFAMLRELAVILESRRELVAVKYSNNTPNAGYSRSARSMSESGKLSDCHYYPLKSTESLNVYQGIPDISYPFHRFRSRRPLS